MTRDEARELMHWQNPAVVTITRNYAKWTGRVVGLVDSPALLIEGEDGRRTAVVLEGASVVREERQDG